MGREERFEKCSKMIKYGGFEGAASYRVLGGRRTFNHLQKTIYTPLYITPPSIGHGRRGNL